jgi:hypothetical protein
MSGCLVSARRSSAGALLILALIACGGGGGDADRGTTGPPPPPPPQPGAVGATGQTSLVAIAGGTTPVAVRVTTVGGVAVPNVIVDFATTTGSVAPSTVNTGSDGIASATWTLGTSAGTQTLTATVASLPAVTFTATVGPAAASTLSPSTGMGQTAEVGQPLPVAPAVIVRDQYGNVLSGAPVTFSIGAGGGSVTGGDQRTNASGIATVGAWTLGTRPGQQTITAASGTLPPLTFTATAGAGPPAQLTKVAGDGQQALAGSSLPTAPRLGVADRFGNPLGAIPVRFTIGDGGGSLAGSASVTTATDSTGVATSARWTLGFASATQTLLASVASLAPVAFTASATSNWQITRASTFTIASVFASEPGFADSKNVAWSTTRLGSPPLLALTCFDDGTMWLSLFHSRLVTRDGIVVYGFDRDAPVTNVWLENSPDFDMLRMTSNTSVRALVPRFLVASEFSIAFAEYLGATYVATFDVRGLALVLPQLMAHCP